MTRFSFKQDVRDFSAVLAVSDNVALGVIECLEAYGKKVPDDVSVMGIDNSETSGRADMGTLAANAVLEMIDFCGIRNGVSSFASTQRLFDLTD